MRMNNSNGFWSYFWSAITGFFTMLTLQDVLFAIGSVVAALFTWLTYRSNNRRNLAVIEEERKRTEIISKAYAKPDSNPPPKMTDIAGVLPQEQ